MPPPLPVPDSLIGRFLAPVDVGARAADLLARAGVDDVAVLAAAVLFPCWYGGIGTTPDRELTDDQLGRVRAALLALGPVTSAPEERHDDYRHRMMRQLCALPALLRAVPLAVARAGLIAGPTISTGPATRLIAGPQDAARLAAGLPKPLVAVLGVEDTRLLPIPASSIPPLGSPDEALAEVRRQDIHSLNFELWVDGAGLIYRVGHTVPAEAVYAERPPIVPQPGSGPPILSQQPGWAVDRISRAVQERDLANDPRYWAPAGPVPLLPGWEWPEQPSPVQGLWADAGAFAPLPAVAEAVRALAADLSTDAWPDRILAWQRGMTAARLVASHGGGESEVTAALLLATDPAGAVPLVPPEAAARNGPAGALATAARATADTPAAALVAAADAVGLAQLEERLFNRLPDARRFGLYTAVRSCPPLAGIVHTEIERLSIDPTGPDE